MSWTGFEWFGVGDEPGSTAITFVGGPTSEWVHVYGQTRRLLTADLGGGDDYLTADTAPSPGSRLAAGAGNDRLYTGTTTGRLDLDMRRDKFWVGQDEEPLPVTGVPRRSPLR